MDVVARAHRLFFHGMLLVVVGLVVGLVVPAFANPRMGLSAHTGMLMNGILLIAMGAFWARQDLGERTETIGWWLLVAGSWISSAGLVAAAAFGTAAMTPIHGAPQAGPAAQEAVVGALLAVGGVGVLGGCIVAVWGLRTLPRV
jgi:(hydroxyamino)benzene mutase